MNKSVLLIGLGVLLASSAASAKFDPPPGYVPASQRQALYQLGNLDTDKDGRLSAEEFGAKVKNYGSIDKENIRRAKKRGAYRTPEEQFKEIDKDSNNFIDLRELGDYIEKQNNSFRGKGRYY